MPAKCAIDGCDALARKRGLCDRHYTAWRDGYIEHPVEGKWKLIQPKYNGAKCCVPGCGLDAGYRGLCKKHYQAWLRGKLKHPKTGAYHSSETKKPKPVDEAYWIPDDGLRYGRCQKCGKWTRVKRSGFCPDCKRRLEENISGSMVFFNNVSDVRFSEMQLIPTFGGFAE
jgi:hypothetical protein